tara:strand:- start:321 stop:506 length:186 start_codon:yes stop_codon:yes gene_type:complete
MKDLEKQGDLRDEYLAIQAAEQAQIHEAIADEQELTEADLDDWYASLTRDFENYEDHKDNS